MEHRYRATLFCYRAQIDPGLCLLTPESISGQVLVPVLVPVSRFLPPPRLKTRGFPKELRVEARVGIEPTLRSQWFPYALSQENGHSWTSLTPPSVSSMLAVKFMASIHRRPGSPYWHAAWRDAHGRLFLRSTKELDKGKALAMAHDFERAEKLAGAGTLTEIQARDILADIVKRSNTGEVFRNYSIAQWLKEWMDGKAARKAESTSVRYQQIVDDFITHLGEKAKRPLAALTARDIQAFLTSRTNGGCSPTTVNLDGKILRTALNQARREGLISVNPAEAVELPSRESVERGTFTAAEVDMLVDAADNPEWRTVILLGYYTGARLGDCCSMVWEGERAVGRGEAHIREGVDLTRGTITYWNQKKRKLVCLPMHPGLHEHLDKLASSDRPSKWICPGMAGLKPGGRHGLSEGFKRIVRKAGLDLETVQGAGKRKISRRTFHALRHSFTSALANAGVTAEIRMKLTGHSSEAVHQGYTHFQIETLRKEVVKVPPVGK